MGTLPHQVFQVLVSDSSTQCCNKYTVMVHGDGQCTVGYTVMVHSGGTRRWPVHGDGTL